MSEDTTAFRLRGQEYWSPGVQSGVIPHQIPVRSWLRNTWWNSSWARCFPSHTGLWWIFYLLCYKKGTICLSKKNTYCIWPHQTSMLHSSRTGHLNVELWFMFFLLPRTLFPPSSTYSSFKLSLSTWVHLDSLYMPVTFSCTESFSYWFSLLDTKFKCMDSNHIYGLEYWYYYFLDVWLWTTHSNPVSISLSIEWGL